jgi:hypothetical protein
MCAKKAAKSPRALSTDACAPAALFPTLTADPVVREQLTRNIQFLGVAGQAALADALVRTAWDWMRAHPAGYR